MNESTTSHRNIASREALESRFARRIASCLNENVQTLPRDVGERLRFAREQAVGSARSRRAAESTQGVGITAAGAAILGLGRSHWWLRVASVAPLVALVGGLVLIQDWQARTQISVAAEVDAALLGDDLPLNAYRDPGFTEFLKASPGE
ncbi:MAG: DUF3619 family protein [Caldimonas sp.]